MIKELSVECFNQYPIWTWDDSTEFHIPLKGKREITDEHGTLFLKCEFKAPNGVVFEGYLVGIDSFYAFGLFLKGAEIVFNLNLKEFVGKGVCEVRDLLSDSNFELFPLIYNSQIKNLDGSCIAGEIRID